MFCAEMTFLRWIPTLAYENSGFLVFFRVFWLPDPGSGGPSKQAFWTPKRSSGRGGVKRGSKTSKMGSKMTKKGAKKA